MPNKRVLITGGAGFIGSHVTEVFYMAGYHVTVFDDLSTGDVNNMVKVIRNIRLEIGDIRDTKLVRKLLKHTDYVVHLAARKTIMRSIQDPISTNDVNVNGTLNLLNESRLAKVKRFVFGSSSSVYEPTNPYAVSKFAAELYCESFKKCYNLDVIRLRFFNVYGPRQKPDGMYPAVIPAFIKAASSGESPIIYGHGNQSRDFTYVEDVASAIFDATTKPIHANQSCFDIGTGNNYTLNEIINYLGDFYTIKKPTHMAARQNDRMSSIAIVGPAYKAFGWESKHTIKHGLRKTVEYHSA